MGVDGRPRVADFGLARLGTAPEVQPVSGEISSRLGLDTPLTVAGSILGTPSYMSPEQHDGAPVDARSDQFSFCVALYEALYGAMPFSGTTRFELAESVSTGAMRAVPAGSPVPPPIEATLRRGMAVDPDARFPSMAALLEDLSIDPRLDRSAAPGARRLLLASLVLILLGAVLLTNLVDGARSKLAVQMFRFGVVQFAVVLSATLILRRRLWWNAFHWGILRAVLISAAQMAVLRWIAMRAGLEPRWIIALDLLAFSAGLATAAWYYLPRAWPAVGLCVGSSIMVAIYPWFMPVAEKLIYPLAMVFVLFLWHRAIRSSATRPASSQSVRTPPTSTSWQRRLQESKRRNSG